MVLVLDVTLSTVLSGHGSILFRGTPYVRAATLVGAAHQPRQKLLLPPHHLFVVVLALVVLRCWL